MLHTPTPPEGLNSRVCGHGDLRITLESICLGFLSPKSDTLGKSFSNRPHVLSDPSDVFGKASPNLDRTDFLQDSCGKCYVLV